MKLSDYIIEQDKLLDDSVEGFEKGLESGNSINIKSRLNKINKLKSVSAKKSALAKLRKDIKANYKSTVIDEFDKVTKPVQEIRQVEADMLNFLGYAPKDDVQFANIKAIKDYSFKQLGGNAKLVNTKVNRHLSYLQFNKLPVKDIIKNINKDLEANNATTLVTTSLSAINRTVASDLATSVGIEWFRYVGANDKLTRPFCKALMTGKNPNKNKQLPVDGKYWHVSWIDKLDNKQIPDVMVNGGGYNCRHRFIAATYVENKDLVDKYPGLSVKFAKDNPNVIDTPQEVVKEPLPTVTAITKGGVETKIELSITGVNKFGLPMQSHEFTGVKGSPDKRSIILTKSDIKKYFKVDIPYEKVTVAIKETTNQVYAMERDLKDKWVVYETSRLIKENPVLKLHDFGKEISFPDEAMALDKYKKYTNLIDWEYEDKWEMKNGTVEIKARELIKILQDAYAKEHSIPKPKNINIDKSVCPYCGDYCYGDCQASKRN